MGDPTWELLPRQGIESGTIKVSFGMERQDLRSAMSDHFLPPSPSTYLDEDDFLRLTDQPLFAFGMRGYWSEILSFLVGL